MFGIFKHAKYILGDLDTFLFVLPFWRLNRKKFTQINPLVSKQVRNAIST